MRLDCACSAGADRIAESIGSRASQFRIADDNAIDRWQSRRQLAWIHHQRRNQRRHLMRTNLWRQFSGTLGQAPTSVVLVVTHQSDGRTSIVEFPNGSQTIVIGQQVAEASYAFIRNGEMIAEAPAVTP